jgi:hypothetical protein
MWRSQSRMVLASIAAVVPGLGLFLLLRPHADGRLGVLLVLVVSGAVYGLVYLAMARLLHIEEVGRLLDQVTGRLPWARAAGRHEA